MILLTDACLSAGMHCSSGAALAVEAARRVDAPAAGAEPRHRLALVNVCKREKRKASTERSGACNAGGEGGRPGTSTTAASDVLQISSLTQL